ncbi:hypothetical protein KZ813_10870 [Sphingomonas sp. RHCKR7]|uniref:hypothetical protein n=1 Tax=Sphingomonas folli TaxID=2862497 RepID=UPI001CA4B894|nr:hypothetical protein [Sphingomonas folli]MBW6527342.1 hypothetical protein [Sphingomonas folli]
MSEQRREVIANDVAKVIQLHAGHDAYVDVNYGNSVNSGTSVDPEIDSDTHPTGHDEEGRRNPIR